MPADSNAINVTLRELAAAIGGEVAGDDSVRITGVASLAEAVAGEITFYSKPKYLAQLRKTAASAVLVPLDLQESIGPALIRVADPEKAFERIALKFAPPSIRYEPGIHPTAVIAADAKLGDRVSVQAHAVIESGVTIGDDTVIGANSYIGHESVIGASCLIYPSAIIRERTLIGNRVIIHSGVVLGADGFGFEVKKDGRQTKIPQIGIVQIDDEVEIGANTTIDRARFGRTWIREGAKIDNLVQIAHNVVVGKHALIAAQAGLAGSARIGDHVMIGGQAGITGHIEIGRLASSLAAKRGSQKTSPLTADFGGEFPRRPFGPRRSGWRGSIVWANFSSGSKRSRKSRAADAHLVAAFARGSKHETRREIFAEEKRAWPQVGKDSAYTPL